MHLSLLTIKRAIALLVSNWMSFLKFLLKQMAISNFYQMHFRKIQDVWGGGIALRSLWTLKRVLELLLTNPKNPLRSIYHQPFHKDLIRLQKITYSPWPESRGGLILEDIISGPLNYAIKKMAISNLWLDVFGEKVGMGRRLIWHCFWVSKCWCNSIWAIVRK